MPSIYNFCRNELKEILIKAGFEGYRSDQVFKLIYKARNQSQQAQFQGTGYNCNSYKYLPKALKEFLATDLLDEVVGTVRGESVSRVDRTRKLLIELDGPKYKVETVVISEKDRNTICVSSQVGCSLACTFCHTGTQKLLKNLSTAEILSQFLLVNSSSPATPVDNVVFMGQGEPLYNWRNVSRAVRILTDPMGIGISKSKVTISTSGISPLIPKISSELGVQLAISLHATTDKLRSKIMPINDTYNLKSVLAGCEEFIKYARCYNRRVSFEYVLLREVNDSICRDAKELVELLRHLPAHVNIIPFNKWPGSEYECSTYHRVIEFNDYLNAHGLRSTIRWSRGEDILAACGQLRSNEELKSKFIDAII